MKQFIRDLIWWAKLDAWHRGKLRDIHYMEVQRRGQQAMDVFEDEIKRVFDEYMAKKNKQIEYWLSGAQHKP